MFCLVWCCNMCFYFLSTFVAFWTHFCAPSQPPTKSKHSPPFQDGMDSSELSASDASDFEDRIRMLVRKLRKRPPEILSKCLGTLCPNGNKQTMVFFVRSSSCFAFFILSMYINYLFFIYYLRFNWDLDWFIFIWCLVLKHCHFAYKESQCVTIYIYFDQQKYM